MLDSDGPQALHHVGVSVGDMDRALAFWERFLGWPARWRQVLDAPYLGQLVGYPNIRIEASIIDLPGGAVLELLRYLDTDAIPNDPATAHPGNVHLCLRVENLDQQWARAVAAGARPVSPAPVNITQGPNTGARTAYLRDPDGVTIELFEPCA